MQIGVNTFGDGLEFDTGYDSLPNSAYIHAMDIRITTSNGESGGSITNRKGNKEAFTIPQEDADGVAEIIGYTTIRNKIILFVADDSGSNGWIYLVMYDEDTREILTGYPQLLYFNANLGFSKEWPIEAYGRFENDNIQRVYWTDYNNFFRSLNIADPDVLTFPLGQIDIFPNIEYTQPRLKTISGGGNLDGGVYQATYRLITLDGKRSLIAPPSNLIHVVSSSETLIQSARYTGDPSVVNTGKAITIEIDTSTYTDFDKIELIIVYHSDLNGIPEVKSVEEISISGNTTIEFTYTGNESSTTIELLDYTSKSHPFKTPKTITQKDNSLVIANIKNSTVSIQDLLAQGETFDAKTYRYNSLGITNNDPFNIDYNIDAHWDPDWHANKQFKYQSNGTTIGGEGVNIAYKFHLEPMTLEFSTDPGFTNIGPFPDGAHNLNDGYSYYNNTYPNNASPFMSGLLRQYKRGETYRFGIVFYTNKGETTFVEYIGDIKFPDISERDDTNNLSGTRYFLTSDEVIANTITGYGLGIQFTIDFSTAPSLLSKIESYQIVRVKREETDKRRATQGIIKTFWFAPIAAPPGSINFDLRVDGSANVVHLMPRYPTNEENATFNTLEDQELAPSPFTPVYDDYLIKGKHLGFYSPDLSYDINNMRELGTNMSNNPCLLITGGYSTYGKSINSTIDLSSENLPDLCEDLRDTCRITNPVTYNSVQNIKKWENATFIDMPDTSEYTEKVTGFYDGYFMRNYYAIDDFTDTTAHLNDPQGTDGTNTSIPRFFRGCSSIVGNIRSIFSDPTNGDPVVGGSTDWFDAPTNIRILNKNTGADNIGLHGLATPIVELVLPKSEVYGGFNTNALESNIFIACSPVIDKTELNPIVFGGDTFVNVFTLQTSTLELNTDFYETNILGYLAYAHDNSTTELYVTESTINIDLDHGATLKRGVTYKVGAFEHTVLRQETNNFNTSYGKSLNMYEYNDLYSIENKDVTFFIKPTNISSVIVNDVRSYLSDTKINGETIDSWTKFGVNNYYDVDDYGPINKILNWKDTVFFVQDRAFGAHSINREAIVTTTDGVQTKIGSGQGFGKHQYISKEHGSIHQYGVKATDSGIYIFDAIHRKLWIATSNAPLSEIKGIHSFLNRLSHNVFLRKENGGDNPILKKGISIGKDIINDELIFTFFTSSIILSLTNNTTFFPKQIIKHPVLDFYFEVTNEFTTINIQATNITLLVANSTPVDIQDITNHSIAYDELKQRFYSYYNETPSIYVENGDIILSSSADDKTILYTHNIGRFGEFYGETKESSITLVINHNADINKILRTIEYNSIVRNDDKEIDRESTITAFKIDTQYQSTGKTFFDPSRIKRKFDKWRIKIPREEIGGRGRLRSTYFVLTLYFDNSENKELILNRILSYYDIQVF